MKTFPILPACLMFGLITTCVSLPAFSAPVKEVRGVLTNTAGMTLYTTDRDPAGKSVCNGMCATNWPPLLAHEGDKASGDYSIITRDDGQKQWALKGKPLYTWAKDKTAGDKGGDGLNNVWHAAKP
jgi:predicted lipoprotein with Yx(FWY)xxD motif